MEWRENEKLDLIKKNMKNCEERKMRRVTEREREDFNKGRKRRVN